MKIQGCVALIADITRNLGKEYARALLAAGASKVYVGGHGAARSADPRLAPIQLDMASPGDIRAAASRCEEVNLLINNTGVAKDGPLLAQGAHVILRRQLDVDVFGLMGLLQGFAPVLARNGGGVVVNALSLSGMSTFVNEGVDRIAKQAALAVSESARRELLAQGTAVIDLFPEFYDPEAGRILETSPPGGARRAVERTIAAIAEGATRVFADQRAEALWKAAAGQW